MKKVRKTSEYQSYGNIRRKYEISAHTLRLWAANGEIKYIRTSDKGKRLYHLGSIEARFGCKETFPEKEKYIYARVSSSHQKEDLQRQIQDLKANYPQHIVLQDTRNAQSS